MILQEDYVQKNSDQVLMNLQVFASLELIEKQIRGYSIKEELVWKIEMVVLWWCNKSVDFKSKVQSLY